jgi:hypothetical protein
MVFRVMLVLLWSGYCRARGGKEMLGERWLMPGSRCSSDHVWLWLPRHRRWFGLSGCAVTLKQRQTTRPSTSPLFGKPSLHAVHHVAINRFGTCNHAFRRSTESLYTSITARIVKKYWHKM